MLLDTHIWIRWLLPTDPLSKNILKIIEEEKIIQISAISCWEVTLLSLRNRIKLPIPIDEWLFEATTGSDIQVLPITCQISQLAGSLPEHHKDPADRIIIATAITHNINLISLDQIFPSYTELDGYLYSDKKR